MGREGTKGGRKEREKGREGEGREGGRLHHGFWGDGRPWSFFKRTRFSNSSSVIEVRLLFIAMAISSVLAASPAGFLFEVDLPYTRLHTGIWRWGLRKANAAAACIPVSVVELPCRRD